MIVKRAGSTAFARLYARHNDAIHCFALESCPITLPLLKLLLAGPWRGTTTTA